MPSVPKGCKLALDPRDDYNHAPDDVSNYNESMYFSVLDLEQTTLDGGFLELGRRCGLGIPSLDLLLDLGEGRHVVADGLGELGHRRVHFLLHLRLLELAEQLRLLSELLLQQPAVLLHRGFGLVGGFGRPWASPRRRVEALLFCSYIQVYVYTA